MNFQFSIIPSENLRVNNFQKISRDVFSSGQTMIEMLVAVGMVALVLVAIVSGVALSVRNSRFSKSKSLATRYAQESIEKFRNYRDEVGWEPFKNEVFGLGSSQEYCLDSLPADLVNLSAQQGACTTEKILNTQGETEFSREVSLSLISVPTEKAQVVVTVTWQEGSRFHDVVLDGQLSSWSL